MFEPVMFVVLRVLLRAQASRRGGGSECWSWSFGGVWFVFKKSLSPPDSRAAGQPLHHCSDFLRRISVRGAPSGASPTAPRQAVIGVGIDLEVGLELDLIAFAFLFQGPSHKFVGLCCNFYLFEGVIL
jgi:hypothetical protein